MLAQILLAERKNISSLTPPKISNSGYSGLEADQKVIAAHGCYAMTATTALTAQDTTTVFDIYQVPSDFVKKQIDACINDIGVDVIKTGKFINQFLQISEAKKLIDERNACFERNN